MNANIFGLFLLSITSYKISQQLFEEPDLSNPRIPLRWRQLCGYRYRPSFQNITDWRSKCFLNPYEEILAYSPPIFGSQRLRRPDSRVLNGRNVTFREAPWVVEIVCIIPRNNGTSFVYDRICTGSLLTMSHILTAGHCISHKFRQGIFLGSDKRQSGHYIPDSEFTWNVHPQYEEDNFFKSWYDFSIIRLHKPLDWRKFEVPSKYGDKSFRVNTVCLTIPPDPEILIDRGVPFQRGSLFGWGQAINDTMPKRLQRADMQFGYNYINDYMFEAPASETQKACPGDSGGGLVQYVDEQETRAVLVAIMVHTGKYKRLPENFTSPHVCIDERIGSTIYLRVTSAIDFIYDQLSQYNSTED